MEKEKGLDYTKSQVEEFHRAFHNPISEKPTPIPEDVALARTIWTAEELIEFLYATAGGNKTKFYGLVTELIRGIIAAESKVIKKGPVEDILVDQMDALTDVNYFVQGSFVVAGVKPQPLFDIVQDANMAKLFPDGKPRYDLGNNGKIIKPEGWQPPEPKIKAEIENQIKKSEEH